MVDCTTGVRAESCASSQDVIVEVIWFIPQERVVADVTSASATGTVCGSSCSVHSGGVAASWSRTWSTSTTDPGGRVEVIQLVRVTVGQTFATDHEEIVKVMQLAMQTVAWSHRLRGNCGMPTTWIF